MRLAMTIEYEGTRYGGFQYQPQIPTIQHEIETAITRLTSETIRVHAAGRTDAGVHATGQVIAFDTASSHPPETFMSALNHYLPPDIAIKAARIAPPDFDPRRNAVSRTYRYSILHSPTPSPIHRRFTYRITDMPDISAMQQAANLLVGTHDFQRFAAPQPQGKSTIRRIHDATVRTRDDIVAIEVTANAFMRHQVRRIAGALLDIVRRRLTTAELQSMLNGAPTDAVAHTLPPQGLCLVSVQYPCG